MSPLRVRFRASAFVLAGLSALAPAPAFAQPKPTPPATPVAPPRAPDAAPSDGTRGDAMRAYHAAFTTRRLGSQEPMGLDYVRRRVAEAETARQNGQNDEAAARLVELVEHPQFEAFADNEEGRAAIYLVGDTLATMGATRAGRGYLRKLLVQKGVTFGAASYAARAVRRLVDVALETQGYAAGLDDVKSVPPNAPEEVAGEVAYLSGRAREASDPDGAIAAYARVTQRSRFWAQATYLAGLTHAQRGRLREGENLFCKVADPKHESTAAPQFSDARFFNVRDLARLGLGRIAHEERRFDNARYYYYLVPRDSSRLPEALYEAATTRYEAKDYEGARELLDELRGVGVHHPYEDEAGVLDAYVDLAQCKFPDADRKLRELITRYEPVRDAARRIQGDDKVMASLLTETRGGGPSAAARAEAGPAVSPETLGAIAALVRIDPAYGAIARKRAVIEREASGLRFTSSQVAALSSQVATAGGVRAALDDRPNAGDDRAKDVAGAIAGLRREIDALEAARVPTERVTMLRQELAALEARGVPSGAAGAARKDPADPGTNRDLPALLHGDAAEIAALAPELEKARREVSEVESAYARDALHRLDLRLSRLLRRARLGRIESVLGKKRALEVEIEAIANGYLPNDAVDSLDAGRYLRDNEEYWPFEGDDWPDEYVGSEGLK